MKHLPEKMVMAAIILSCGFFAHSEPSAREHKFKHVSSGKLSAKPQEFATRTAVAPAGKLARYFGAPGSPP